LVVDDAFIVPFAIIRSRQDSYLFMARQPEGARQSHRRKVPKRAALAELVKSLIKENDIKEEG